MTVDHDTGDFAVDLGDWCQDHAEQISADFDRYFTGFNGRHFERFSAMGSADPNRFADGGRLGDPKSGTLALRVLI